MTDKDKGMGQTSRYGEMLPFESWEKLDEESSAAFAAFSAYRDYGPERNMRKAVEAVESDPHKAAKRYRVWRLWSMQHKWLKRAADYDRYCDRLKLAERRKVLETLEEKQGKIINGMLDLTGKKVALMTPDDLSPTMAVEFLDAAARTKRELTGLDMDRGGKDNPEENQSPVTFGPDFEGL
ncbi:hypothetical protein FACS189485_08160 [Spirochaetia bacterium]|nr:hypothetical protein FACS189485_08160 [Spirochaetia bacterium]